MKRADDRATKAFRSARRDWLRWASSSAIAASMSGWFAQLAVQAASQPTRARRCILLWMNGGPSQIDTFDPKPGHENGGPFKPIATQTPGIHIGEYLPQVSHWTDRLAIIRSMSGKEADHGRASYLVRTGRAPEAAIQYPTLGSLMAKELGDESAALPSFVSIAPYRSTNLAAYNPGFLGPTFAPFIVGDVTPAGAQQQAADAYRAALQVADLRPPSSIPDARQANRLGLWRSMEQAFVAGRPDIPAESHAAAYDRAVRLMHPDAASAFTLDQEPDKLRDAYGRTMFGQGCLLARRLIERGVPFVEVSLGGINSGGMGWDTHVGNFETVKRLCGVLDPAWATLLRDLSERGLLDTTLVIWMGEFGRTPKINGTGGRDHYPLAWSAVLGGGGIHGGQVVGRTSDDGTIVADRPTAVPELLATACAALGIDPHKTNPSNLGRPIHLIDYAAQPIDGVAT
ncbi:MAG TPA: DUF1501 domain-containing protein [Pirellulales bacterium]|nr:DUF1501 domain-containing protein [Pirellulales bacterium]